MRLSSQHLCRSIEDFSKDAIKSSILLETVYGVVSLPKLCLKYYVFRSYQFLVQVTFNYFILTMSFSSLHLILQVPFSSNCTSFFANYVPSKLTFDIMIIKGQLIVKMDSLKFLTSIVFYFEFTYSIFIFSQELPSKCTYRDYFS